MDDLMKSAYTVTERPQLFGRPTTVVTRNVQTTIAVPNEEGPLLVDRPGRDGINLYTTSQTVTAGHQDHTQARLRLGDTSQEAKYAIGVVIAASATMIDGVLTANVNTTLKQP
jgi:hypothetical protein